MSPFPTVDPVQTSANIVRLRKAAGLTVHNLQIQRDNDGQDAQRHVKRPGEQPQQRPREYFPSYTAGNDSHHMSPKRCLVEYSQNFMETFLQIIQKADYFNLNVDLSRSCGLVQQLLKGKTTQKTQGKTVKLLLRWGEIKIYNIKYKATLGVTGLEAVPPVGGGAGMKDMPPVG